MKEKSKPRVLIAEDDTESQKFLRIFLRRKFEFEFCDSDITFYQKLKESDFDIILMDISLHGEKDGLQLTKEIRNNPKYKNMPIVGLSAHAFQKDRANAYEAGVDIFITKPVQGNQLMESLTTALEQKTGIKID